MLKDCLIAFLEFQYFFQNGGNVCPFLLVFQHKMAATLKINNQNYKKVINQSCCGLGRYMWSKFQAIYMLLCKVISRNVVFRNRVFANLAKNMLTLRVNIFIELNMSTDFIF